LIVDPKIIIVNNVNQNNNKIIFNIGLTFSLEIVKNNNDEIAIAQKLPLPDHPCQRETER